MYLKRLELQGFKSFPEKIKLEFNKGITVVVGPNGSGKSNIADAVRWVLGEKSAKSLRGAKMEDVIFNGTANRKPMGFAEVSMVMDNTDRVLNVDFSEVTVTRRVFRSGDSDYLINGSSCRLKDILELFMDTGVGKEGYSIIGQGRIDEILSTKSEDRRMLFEEAAGIVKYKTRRTEAANKLEKEHANLVRVNDIISELETQVGPLEKQAEKTKKYLVLSDRLKLVQVNLFIREADEYQKELEKLNDNINQLHGNIAEEEDKKQLLTLKSQKQKDSLASLEEKMQSGIDDIAEKRSQWEQRENDIKLFESDILHISDNINRIESEISDALKQKSIKENQIDIIKSEMQGKSLRLDNQNSLYHTKQQEFEQLNTRVSESEEQVDNFNSLVISKMNKITDLKSEISKTEILSEQYITQKETLLRDIDGLKSEINEKQVEQQVIEKRCKRIDDEARLINEHIDKFVQKQQSLSKEISEKSSEVESLNKKISEKNSRLKIISELEKEYEGYYGGVKAILKQRDNKNPDFKGICGAVGEVINMDKRFETAIEIALGGAVQNIITRNDESVKAAIAFLKNTGKGRATFLPMTAVKGRPLGNEKHNLLKNSGVVGIAKELINYSPEYENIMSNLLDRVIVVDNIDNGSDLAKKTSYAYKIVTLDGELFNPGGSVTGGSINKKSAGIFSRGREIAELKVALKGLLENQFGLNNTLEQANQQLENTVYKLNEAKEEQQQLVIEFSKEKNNLSTTKSQYEQLVQRESKSQQQVSELAEKIENSENRVAIFSEQLSELNDDINSIYQKLEQHQNLIKNDREIREKYNNEIVALRLEINQLENEISTSDENIKRINAEIDVIVNQNSDALKQIDTYKKELDEKSSALQKAEGDIVQLKAEYEKMQNEMESFNQQKVDLSNEIEKIAQNITQQLETIATLNNQLTRLDSRNEQTKQKSQQLYNSMWETYEITYVAAKEYEQLELSNSELQKEASGLRGQIRNLGNVNVNAVEEYKAVKERFDFLTNQRNDIIDSEEKLNKVIVQLEELMEMRFREQFAVISENFTRVFRTMFGGGTAGLKLSDDNDILNCGIDIIAQPPGKALQNMMLLSGGEKALTAMSLLFAILEMKPSPFCILDEIEAALDDANVNRYAEYLKHFTDTTQFVVISHRKGTMEAADILYGVTMQEQGVSKLVSVDFTNERNVE